MILTSSEVYEAGLGCDIPFLMACNTCSLGACGPWHRTVLLCGQRRSQGISGRGLLMGFL